MMKATLEYVAVLGAMFVLGPAAALLLRTQVGPDGTPNFTGLVNAAPAVALLLHLLVLAFAGVGGILFGRLVSRSIGMAFVGLTLLVAAWHTGSSELILRASPSGGTLTKMAVEGLILGAAGVLIAAFVHIASGMKTRELLISSVLSRGAWAGILAGAAAGAVGCWAGAFDMQRGQTLLAAILAGIAAGAGGTLAAAALTPHDDPQAAPVGGGLSPLIGIVLLAVIGPLVAARVHAHDLLPAVVRGDFFRLGRPLPLDWVAGAFLGVPWGAGWVAALAEKKPAPAQA